jgi:hypothetical protein
MNDNTNFKNPNGWVFISHSSEDYQSVKIVRNYLEESGFNALIFYLKSLEDPKKRKLTQQLIEWEIEKRNIFVFCKSKYSKSSKWVQDEIAYVKSFPEKIYVEIDIEKLLYEKCTQLSKLDRLMKRATLFFSYSYKDKEFVIKIYEYLKSEGFKIWIDSQDIRLGDNWIEEINKGFNKAINNGHILYFVSRNSIASEWNKAELNLALASGASILPIIIDDVDISNGPLINYQCFYINPKNFEKKKRKLLLALKKVEKL